MKEIETGKYIVHLIYSLLNRKKPKEKPASISFEDLFRMAVKHNVIVMTYDAVEMLDEKPDEIIRKQWLRRRDISCTQSAAQLVERDAILSAFSENEIECLPLKGCLMKEMYPKPEYREMSDLDILIHESDRERVRETLENIGYCADDESSDKDDSYRKAPFMHVEIHWNLFENKTIDRLNIRNPFVLDPFQYSLKTENRYIYKYTWEDFYIYMMLHNAKHCLFAGAGIRQFVDLSVFHEKHKLDSKYVEKELESCGLSEFMKESERLTDLWQSDQEVPDDLQDLQTVIFTSGSYGNSDVRILNNMIWAASEGNSSASRYLRFRFFPPLRIMRAVYPVLKKHPSLLPVFWVYRIIFKGLPDIGHFVSELNMFNRIRKDK